MGDTRDFGIESSYDATTRFPPSNALQASRAHLVGRLHLDVREVLDDGRAAQVGIALSRLAYERDGLADSLAASAMSAPFTARVEATGEFDDFRFAPGLSTQERSELADLVRLFQIVVPRSAGTVWTSEERHAMGRFEARYVRHGDGTILKQKTRYVETTPMLRALGEVDVVRSEVRVRRTPGAPWVDSVTVDDEIRVGTVAEPRLFMLTHARLDAIDDAERGALSRADAPTTERTEVAHRDARPASNSSSGAADFSGVSDRLREAGAGVAEFRDLTVLLGRTPELAGEVAALLRVAALPEASANVVIDALGAVASPEAQ